jgi:hypothetical protein
MKKIYLLLFLGVFIINNTFSQMSFTGNPSQKSAFDLTEKKVNTLNNNFSNSKILITTEEKDMMAKRRRSSRSRGGGSSDGGFYAFFGAGYGLGQNTENLDGFSIKKDTTIHILQTKLDILSSDEQINLSMGKGICINWGLGYMINGNFGFELGMSYLIGAKTTGTHTNIDVSDNTFPITTTSENERTYSANMFKINPSIIISSGMEGINPYAKFGMIFGFASINREDNNSSSAFYSSSDTTIITKTALTMKADGGVAIGFSAAFGCNFMINSNLSFFGEFNLVSLTYAPTKSEYTSYSIDSEDILSNMTIAQKQIEYYDILKPNSTQTKDMPSQALKKSISFGSIGLNIGMKISF